MGQTGGNGQTNYKVNITLTIKSFQSCLNQNKLEMTKHKITLQPGEIKDVTFY